MATKWIKILLMLKRRFRKHFAAWKILGFFLLLSCAMHYTCLALRGVQGYQDHGTSYVCYQSCLPCAAKQHLSGRMLRHHIQAPHWQQSNVHGTFYHSDKMRNAHGIKTMVIKLFVFFAFLLFFDSFKIAHQWHYNLHRWIDFLLWQERKVLQIYIYPPLLRTHKM